jgi:hypothetical protein
MRIKSQTSSISLLDLEHLPCLLLVVSKIFIHLAAALGERQLKANGRCAVPTAELNRTAVLLHLAGASRIKRERPPEPHQMNK